MISLTSPVETWAHRIPAAVKLATLSVVTVGLFALQNPYELAMAFAASAGLVLTAGLSFTRAAIANLRIVLPFLILIAVWHAVTGQIAAGMAVALRLLTALTLANFVTMTTRLSDMIAVASALMAPFRRLGFSTRAFELSIALVVRFTPAVAHKGGMLSQAWRARSRRRPGWRLIMPLAGLAIDDAEHVAEALRARGGLETINTKGS